MRYQYALIDFFVDQTQPDVCVKFQVNRLLGVWPKHFLGGAIEQYLHSQMQDT